MGEQESPSQARRTSTAARGRRATGPRGPVRARRARARRAVLRPTPRLAVTEGRGSEARPRVAGIESQDRLARALAAPAAIWVSLILFPNGAFLLVPLCAPSSLVGWLVPSAIGTLVYGAGCAVSVRLGWPWVWPIAGVLGPVPTRSRRSSWSTSSSVDGIPTSRAEAWTPRAIGPRRTRPYEGRVEVPGGVRARAPGSLLVPRICDISPPWWRSCSITRSAVFTEVNIDTNWRSGPSDWQAELHLGLTECETGYHHQRASLRGLVLRRR